MASSTKRRVPSSSISFWSTDGWAEKSKSARVNGEGSEAKRARLARRRSSTASTSTASSRSRNVLWLRSAAWPRRVAPAAPRPPHVIRRKARWARRLW